MSPQLESIFRRMEAARPGVIAWKPTNANRARSARRPRRSCASAYYGVHTLRAVENFPITGNADLDLSGPDPRARVHQAGGGAREPRARTARRGDDRRHRQGLRGNPRRQAARSVRRRTSIQGGAGTSTNMNANEVIANLALEHLGHARGEYQVPAPERTRQHEPEHQRRVSDVAEGRRRTSASSAWSTRWLCCAARSRPRRRNSSDVLKMGRTQLQDAVPMTLGQEFSTYAVMLGEDEERLKEAALLIREINLGATAIGTGINAHPDYAEPRLPRLVGDHRHSARHRAQPDRGHAGLRRVRAAVGRAQARRRQAVEDLQRPAAPVQRTARGSRRDQPAADAGRLEHHARQGRIR